METKTKSTPVEPPRGSFSASVDDKGRLKLPVNFQQYLGAGEEQKLFVTSLDGRIARIYPISVWTQNENFLAALAADDPQAADAIGFMANHYGAEGKMDAQGRVTLPTELRRELALENQEVRVDCSMGGINVYSMKEYEARNARYRENLEASLSAAKRKGFR